MAQVRDWMEIFMNCSSSSACVLRSLGDDGAAAGHSPLYPRAVIAEFENWRRKRLKHCPILSSDKRDLRMCMSAALPRRSSTALPASCCMFRTVTGCRKDESQDCPLRPATLP